jgi:hypothetical protein
MIFLLGGCGGVVPLSAEPGDAGTDTRQSPSDGGVQPGGDAAAEGGPADAGAQPCVTSLECPDGLTCIEGMCARKRRGSLCDQADECASGFCADGVCCDVACAGGCRACNQTGRAGTCWPVENGQRDPHGVCVDQGGASCGTSGTCDGLGACERYAAGTVCAASTCVGNAFEGARVCDGLGTCGAAPPLHVCAPYACNPANCLNACTSDLGCAGPAVCVSGTCRTLPKLVFNAIGPSSEIGGFYTDSPVDDACAGGAAVVGYDVTVSSDPNATFVDRVRTICGALHVGHAQGLTVDVGDVSSLAERGTGSGDVVRLRCPAHQVVVGFDGRAGAFVDQLGFRCAPLLVAGDALALGAVTVIGPAGGSGGGAKGPIDCGPAALAVGSRTLADTIVKKMALVCAQVGLN